MEKVLKGRYEILKSVGLGGMSEVWLALDTQTRQTVAVKVLDKRLTQEDTFSRRFAQELAIARLLNHPGIPRLIDDGQTEDGVPFIVMEYVQGITLTEYVRQKGPLPIEEAVAIASQVLTILSYAYSKGIQAHRDIKPGNIMIDLRTHVVTVMDFGIAKTVGSSLTHSTVLYTPKYAAPEQLLPSKFGGVVDKRADLYALGVVLYEMLTGRAPFGGETPAEISGEQITSSPPSPSSIRRDIPSPLSQILLKCLQPNPSSRYQTPEDLLQDLKAGHVGETRQIPSTAREDQATVIRKGAGTPFGQEPIHPQVPEVGQQAPRRRSGVLVSLVGLGIAVPVLMFGMFTPGLPDWLFGGLGWFVDLVLVATIPLGIILVKRDKSMPMAVEAARQRVRPQAVLPYIALPLVAIVSLVWLSPFQASLLGGWPVGFALVSMIPLAIVVLRMRTAPTAVKLVKSRLGPLVFPCVAMVMIVAICLAIAAVSSLGTGTSAYATFTVVFVIVVIWLAIALVRSLASKTPEELLKDLKAGHVSQTGPVPAAGRQQMPAAGTGQGPGTRREDQATVIGKGAGSPFGQEPVHSPVPVPEQKAPHRRSRILIPLLLTILVAAIVTVMVLKNRKVPVTITSTPSGASIYLDGTDAGKYTPATFALALGTHTVKLKKEDYLEYEGSVQLTAAGTTKTLSATLTAAPSALPAPQLLAPSSGSIVSTTPTLSWAPVVGASSYSVEVYRRSSGSDQSDITQVFREGAYGSSITLPVGTLQAGTSYAWIVWAYRSSVNYNYSAAWVFTTTR